MIILKKLGGNNMMCYNPIRLDTMDYFREHGVILSSKRFFNVPCGKCLACLSQKAKEWTMRLSHEWYYYNETNSMFITLTYDSDNIPSDYGLHKRDIQLFMKRLRKQCDKENIKLKYFVAGEYGFQKHRPHYHMILFGLPNQSTKLIRDVNKYSVDYKLRGRHKLSKYDRLLFRCWKKGNIRIGYCSLQSLQYCSLYTLKGNHIVIGRKEYYERYKKEKPFRQMSRGIGRRYSLEFRNNLIENLKINYNDVDTSIPRSYLNWIENDGFDIRDKIKEKRLIDIDKEIQLLYNEFGIEPKTIFDFPNVEDYYDLTNHGLLYKIYQNRLITKRYKYESRHDKYKLQKLTNVIR